MTLSIICATSENGIIGINNQLPWRFPADLKRFKTLTMNHPVIMGRKTFESIGKPLPGRKNIVITHQHRFQAEGCLVVSSLEKALQLCQDEKEIFVIGGASIYEQVLPSADKIYLTVIHHKFEGDTQIFPLNRSIWKESSRQDHQPDQENPYPYSFLIFEKHSSDGKNTA